MLTRFSLAKRALLDGPRRFLASQAAPSVLQCKTNNIREHDVIHGFVVDEVERVNEMYLDAIRLTHIGTGAQYIHLNRDDSNNVFSLGFRTTPMNSTGLPHILEHITLCGSEKYPVSDPFMKMLRRSMATFMNAMTGPDYTIYPFSTQNQKDYKNLQSVYADAVFKPRLRETDFYQEGWRLEHTDLNDNKSPIIIKGVVYNEMKGVFNENQSIFSEKLLNAILPSHTYGVCSGGEPLVIPQLTHQALKDFHSQYYHPSNSRIFSYGNFPLEDHLKFINDTYLSSSQKIDISSSRVPSEKRWTTPRHEHVACRPDPMAPDASRQNSIAIAHLCNDITDTQATLELHILSELLLKGPTAAFYKSFIESNLATGFGPFTGYESQLKDTIFSVSLQGVRSEDFDKIEKTYDETVQQVIDNGFDKDHIEAVLHGIELRMKHQTSSFGMNLLFSLTSIWNHDGDLIESMKINKSIKSLTEKIENNPKYLNNLVEKYFLKNTHKLVLTMSPEEDYDVKFSMAEEKVLNDKLKECTEEEREKIFEAGKFLRAEQEKKEDLSILPTLKVTDIKEDVDRYDTDDVKIVDIPVQISIQPTNGVSYYRGILGTHELSNELKQLIPIFNNVIAKMGTKSHNYRDFDRLCQLKTGGLSFSSHIAEDKNNISKYEEGIIISSYCLDHNADKMWNLWTELFNEVDLNDYKRFETLVKTIAGDLSNGIADSGHHYAMSSAAGLVSPAANFKESIFGLEYVGRMKRIAQEKSLMPILEKIQEIRNRIFNKSNLRSAINLSDDNKDKVLAGMSGFYSSLNGNYQGSIQMTDGQIKQANEVGIHHIMPYTTNYSSKAISTVPYTHEDYPALKILAKIISTAYLLPEVREKEGAYGSGASLSSEGVFLFYSFRDPNSTKTFDTFDRTYDFVRTYDFKQTDLDEAKLGVFQQIDSPVSPGSRGLLKFTYNITDDDVQAQRLKLKAVTREDILRVAEKYLLPGTPGIRVGRAMIGAPNADLLSRKTENWHVISQEEDNELRAAE